MLVIYACIYVSYVALSELNTHYYYEVGNRKQEIPVKSLLYSSSLLQREDCIRAVWELRENREMLGWGGDSRAGTGGERKQNSRQPQGEVIEPQREDVTNYLPLP